MLQKNQIHLNAILLLALALLFPTSALAAQFEATVNTTKVSLHQSIRLKLSLTDATAKEEPDLSGLQTNFTIHGSQKFKNFASVNGKSSSEEGWQITLRPKMPGELIIPVISLKTDQGMQHTQAINIYVDAVAIQDDLPVSIQGGVEKNEVFVQEPFVLKVKVFNEAAIANASIDKFEIADCAVEETREPKHNRTIINGKQVETAEIQYLITPLKSGNIEIPPVLLRGDIQIARAGSKRFPDPFDNLGLLGNFNQMQEYEPFMVQTTPVKIKVKPAIAEVNPWLPLYKLEAKETWQGLEQPHVGEPIIRSITLHAMGVNGKQLPNLKAFHEVKGIKVYADDPKFDSKIDFQTNKIQSSRKEQFSLIPMQAGVVTIPTISITWWDLGKGQKTVTVLPGKQIEVIDIPTVNNSTNGNSNADVLVRTPIDPQVTALYLIIALLVVALCGIGLFVRYYSRKMQRLLLIQREPAGNHDIKSIHDLRSLQEFIREYATKNWGLSENFVLKDMPVQLIAHGFVFDQALADQLFVALDKALYGGEEIVIDELKIQWQAFSKGVMPVKNKQEHNATTLGKLNPT